MVKQLQTVLERIMHYQPEAAVTLDAVEDKETLTRDLEKIFEFLQQHELRPGDKNCSHINYRGVAISWYSTLSGRYLFAPEELPALYSAMAKVGRLGIPLQLVECKDGRLALFPLYFDIDVKLDGETAEANVVENEIIDEKEGFRFLKIFSKILNTVFSHVGDIAVLSATGGKKVSLRLVYPSLVVDREKAQRVYDYVVQRLLHLCREDTPVPFVRTLQKRLKQLSPLNGFERVVDECTARCRFGIRMAFNDKTEPSGQRSGRPLKPLFVLSPELGLDDKISNLKVTRLPLHGDEADEIDWIRLTALITPSLNHAGLTECTVPDLKKMSRVTKTGASGSSLAILNLTLPDAARAAARASRRGAANTGPENSEPVMAKFFWHAGTVEKFKGLAPVGITAQVETSQDGTVTWRIANRRNNWISFNESSKLMEASAPSKDAMQTLMRYVNRYPGVVPLGTASVPAPIVAAEEKKFRVKQAFVAEGEGELSVNVDETVVLFNEDDGSGWVGVRKDGQKGYVPTSFLEPLA